MAFVRRAVLPALIGGLYCLLAASTIMFASNGKDIASVWPANAVLVAILSLRAHKEWPGFLLAGFLGNAVANVITRGTIEGPILFSLANMTEVLIAAIALHRRADQDSALQRPDMVFRFLLWCGLIAPGISAFMGAATAVVAFDQPFLPSLRTWFFADSLGLLFFTPLFHALFRGDFIACFREKTTSKRFETLGLQLLTAVTAYATFFSEHWPILFLPAIPVLAVNFRVGWTGVKLSMVIVAIFASIATIEGHGPVMLIRPGSVSHAEFVQFYLASLLLTNLPIAMALAAKAKATRQLADSERSVRMLTAHAATLLLHFDREGRCIQASGSPALLQRASAESLVGCQIADIDRDKTSLLRLAHEKALAEGVGCGAIEFQPADADHDIWLEAILSPLADERGEWSGTVASIYDVSERKRYIMAVERMAQTDALTSHLNRHGFMSRLESAVARSGTGKLAVAMIDLDRFKQINDTKGHLAGDAVLVEIAARIAEQTGDIGKVGRLGGDEFAILFDGCDHKSAVAACEAAINAVSSNPICLPTGERVEAAICCGLSTYRRGDTASSLLREADKALYGAKRAGGNRLDVASKARTRTAELRAVA